jgi:hypothetical protein
METQAASAFSQGYRNQVDVLMAAGKPDTALELLLKLESEYSGDAEYDYLLGNAALAVGQNSLALHAFERVVLVEPRHAGAWIDLAIANMRMGDTETAASLVQHVEENFDPPANLRAELSAIKSRLAIAPLVRDWRGEATLQLGYVQNANSGLSQSDFQITPVGGSPIPVELDASQKPKSDHAVQLNVGLVKSVQHDDGASGEFMGAVRARHYGSLTDNDFMDVGLGWLYNKPIGVAKDTAVQVGPMLRYLQLGGDTIAYFASLQGGLTQRMGRCRVGVRGEWERRDYQQAGYYSATIPWLGGELACAGQTYEMRVLARHGVDKPDNARPGGKTYRNEASFNVRAQITPAVMVDALVYLADYRDAQGYSVLLENNVRRYIHRIGERIGINWQLPLQQGQWSLQADMDKTNDISNIPISRVEDVQVFVGLRYGL